jgi:hypothetical protein
MQIPDRSRGSVVKFLVLAVLLPAVMPLQANGQSEAPAAWETSAALYGYWYPAEAVTFLPIVRADRGQLHLEGRYNYEDVRTGSVFAGWNLSWEGDVDGTFTPMVGLVVGQTSGIAPALELDASYDPISLYTEWEYVFDFEDRSSDFFYSWTELTVYPADWIRIGVVGQSTRVVDTGREVQRGFLVGGEHGNFGLTFHMFNPDDADPYYVFSFEALL